MKTVFTNAQLAHVWAQQTQEHGYSTNMFFEGNKIYSYGYHFLAANIVEIEASKTLLYTGKQIALVNSKRYSNSTAKHLSLITSALRGKIDYFYVPNPSDLKSSENKNYHRCGIENRIKLILSKKKVTTQREIDYEIENLCETIETSNKYFRLTRTKEYVLDPHIAQKINDHLNAGLKRYQELNTPEMIAKKEAIKQAKLEKLNAEKIADFRAGKNVHLSLPYDLIRLQGDKIVTSRQAEVPLKAALKILDLYKKDHDISGLPISDFKIETLSQLGSDTVIKIGCHKILLSEAINVIGKVA